jgi:hypothetical protein
LRDELVVAVTVNIKPVFFWDVTPCSLLKLTDFLEKLATFIITVEVIPRRQKELFSQKLAIFIVTTGVTLNLT